MTNIPANKDYFLQINTDDYSRFRLKDSQDATIYEGIAYAAPNAIYANVNVTKILENYVSNHLPERFGISSTYPMALITDAYKTFTAEFLDSAGTWEEIEEIGILAWYDYDSKPSNYTDLVLADPVNGHSAAGVIYTRSRLAQGIVTNLITTAATSEYEESFCGRYGITYLNRMGGYDFFLFEGKYSMSDNYDYFEYNRTYDNNYNGFGLSRYQNSYETTWTLSTGWLTDEESYRFAKHIMGSTQIWIQDLEKHKVIPVVMVDASTEYKTYEGKGLVCYTVKLKTSQERIRK